MKHTSKKLSTIAAMALAAGISLTQTPTALADGYAYCEVDEILEGSDRIHVHCRADAGGRNIRYWAVSTSNATRADRFLQIATAALLSGKKMKGLVTTAANSGSLPGCLAGDCRVPSQVLIVAPGR